MTDQELVDALCEIESGLTEWEVEFVESLANQLDQGRALSDRQRAKAEQVWRDRA